MLRFVFILLLFHSAKSTLDFEIEDNGLKAYIETQYSFWPSAFYGVKAHGLKKRDVQQTKTDFDGVGLSEGGKVNELPNSVPAVHPKYVTETVVVTKADDKSKVSAPKESIEPTKPPVVKNDTAPNKNVTADTATSQPSLNSPGVVKRGLIVFGGFGLLAVAYYVFFKRKGSNKDSATLHNTSENNQFRYGVLQSNDQRDNLELSRVPLTMDSEEEEEDEDLEIFDLGQKKQSMSYVNLHSTEDDHHSKSDNNAILLDIEDSNNDPLINWSSNGN